MNQNLDRRDFTKQASVVVGGLLTGALLGSRRSLGQEREMSDKRSPLATSWIFGLPRMP